MSEAERVPFLDAIAERALRREVDAMLEAYLVASQFLEEVPWPEALGSEMNRVGTRISAYRLDEQIGEGGMGRVFKAFRDDGSFDKRVAIKILRLAPGDQALQRFRLERQVLARLEHANIASLLDGGTTEEGLPFLVMEYVDGEPIDVYCDRNRLDLRARLRLFLEVCEAVSHAHQALVVHRDLKPSNILVATDGTAKLLDFGIAKWLGPKAGHLEIEVTQTAGAPMTPAYASPEQVRGELVTTATDVYALGVVLYELLTGVRPHQPSSPTSGWRVGELCEAICERTPERPSQAVQKTYPQADQPILLPEEIARRRGSDRRRLEKALAGDLDTLVRKAMHRDAERRYGSVVQLADDIRRHLGSHPIAARPDTLSYRLDRFLRRRPLWAAGFVLILALLVGLTFQTLEATRQRDLAEVERAKALEVNSFTLDIFGGTDPAQTRGSDTTLIEFLEVASDRIEDELENRPRVQAQMMDMIGSMFFRLGRYDEARPHLERAFELRQETQGTSQSDLADSLDMLAELAATDDLPDQAEPKYLQAIELRRRLGKTAALARSLNNYGLFLAAQDRLDQAETRIAEALELAESDPSLDPAHLAGLMSSLASLEHRRGEVAKALQLFDRALRINERHLESNHPKLLVDRHNLGQLLLEAGRLRDAEKMARSAAEVADQVFGEEHPTSRALALGYCRALRMRGRVQAAIDLCAPWIPRAERQGPGAVVQTTLEVADLMILAGRVADAERLMQDAREVAEGSGLSASARAAIDLRWARIWLARQRPERALESLASSFEGAARDADGKAPASLPAEMAKALVLEEILEIESTKSEGEAGLEGPAGELTQRLRTLEAQLQRVLKRQSEELAPNHPGRVSALMAMGRLSLRRGDVADAGRFIESARRALADEVERESALWAEHEGLEGEHHRLSGRLEEGRALLRSAHLRLQSLELHPENSPLARWAAHRMAKAEEQVDS
ncbi:MAG: serine/threonine-protein kinase [Acidobacteriota bacterium]